MKRFTRNLGLTLAATVALSISIDPDVLLTAAPQPSEHSADRWSNLPPRIRRELYLSTAELPAFPAPDSLKDIRRWPATWTLEGRSYRLRISAMDWDAIYEVPDRNKIEPDHSYGAQYMLDAAEPRSRRRAGPSYWWLPEGTLAEQAYRSPDLMTQMRGYDAKGVLQQFKRYSLRREHWLSCGPAQPVSLEEWFDENGNLLGFRALGVCYWDGTERTSDEYSRLWQEWRQMRPLWRRKPAA